MINSRSLHKSNIVFAFKNQNIVSPENSEMTALYPGDSGKGVQLVDDPMMRMKILDVPKFNLQVAWEGQRLRIEDMKSMEPEESLLIEEAMKIYEKLVSGRGVHLEGFGFNFEVFYQTSDVIKIGNYYNEIMREPMEIGDGLLDFGWQWKIAHKNGEQIDGYFLKITAPLEFVIHHNAHFNAKEIPSLGKMKEFFKKSCEKTHNVADSLKL